MESLSLLINAMLKVFATFSVSTRMLQPLSSALSLLSKAVLLSFFKRFVNSTIELSINQLFQIINILTLCRKSQKIEKLFFLINFAYFHGTHYSGNLTPFPLRSPNPFHVESCIMLLILLYFCNFKKCFLRDVKTVFWGVYD